MLTLVQRLLMMLLAFIALSSAVTPSASFAGPGCGSATTVANEDEEEQEDEEDGEDDGDEEEERA